MNWKATGIIGGIVTVVAAVVVAVVFTFNRGKKPDNIVITPSIGIEQTGDYTIPEPIDSVEQVLGEDDPILDIGDEDPNLDINVKGEDGLTYSEEYPAIEKTDRYDFPRVKDYAFTDEDGVLCVYVKVPGSNSVMKVPVAELDYYEDVTPVIKDFYIIEKGHGFNFGGILEFSEGDVVSIEVIVKDSNGNIVVSNEKTDLYRPEYGFNNVLNNEEQSTLTKLANGTYTYEINASGSFFAKQTIIKGTVEVSIQDTVIEYRPGEYVNEQGEAIDLTFGFENVAVNGGTIVFKDSDYTKYPEYMKAFANEFLTNKDEVNEVYGNPVCFSQYTTNVRINGVTYPSEAIRIGILQIDMASCDGLVVMLPTEVVERTTCTGKTVYEPIYDLQGIFNILGYTDISNLKSLDELENLVARKGMVYVTPMQLTELVVNNSTHDYIYMGDGGCGSFFVDIDQNRDNNLKNEDEKAFSFHMTELDSRGPQEITDVMKEAASEHLGNKYSTDLDMLLNSATVMLYKGSRNGIGVKGLPKSIYDTTLLSKSGTNSYSLLKTINGTNVHITDYGDGIGNGKVRYSISTTVEFTEDIDSDIIRGRKSIKWNYDISGKY